MAASLPDLVDCTRLAADSAVLERSYEFGELARVKDLLTEPRGTLRAKFAFEKLSSGRCGAHVSVEATPVLECQRCLQGFSLALDGGSDVEFGTAGESAGAQSEREFFEMQNGLVSLRELAEEELLLAIPVAPACSTPLTCGKAPGYAAGTESPDEAGDMRRPFGGLKDLLKKTLD